MQMYISIPEHLLIGPERVDKNSKIHKKIQKILDSIVSVAQSPTLFATLQNGNCNAINLAQDEDRKPNGLHKIINDKTKLLIYILKEKHSNEVGLALHHLST